MGQEAPLLQLLFLRRAIVAMVLKRLLLHDALNDGRCHAVDLELFLLDLEDYLTRDECSGAVLGVKVE